MDALSRIKNRISFTNIVQMLMNSNKMRIHNPVECKNYHQYYQQEMVDIYILNLIK